MSETMAKIIDARHIFAPHTSTKSVNEDSHGADAESGLFSSGDTVAPGVYRDIEAGSTITVRETDTLPEGMRIVHFTRQFRLISATKEAGIPAVSVTQSAAAIQSESALRRAA